ncbi:MAG: hypothetical protein C0591_05595 [Marinilabiliales bacterium]|nr:MAG: hypothetical protein C0591_05595 [Marinilabiliales bacterium]
MKKFTLSLLTLLIASSFVYAGGLVTNTNQSTAWTRMLVRDASIDIDAVFFNPAGLTKLEDGFYISISNQSIFQKQTINSGYPYLNDPEYVGNISAPLFPSAYLAYKTGRWAFSLGFNPYGGGGGASFDRGLPMIEAPIAGAAHQFAPYGVTGYSADIAFEGTSVYYGLQGGISFAINKNISIFAGARYVMANNTYTGSLQNASFNTAEGTVRADAFMLGLADQAQAGAAQANYVGTQMQPLIDYGAGDYTVTQLVQAGLVTPEQGALMAGGLIQLGFSPEVVNQMPVSTMQATYFGAAGQLEAQATELTVGAGLMGDQEADVTQTGSAVTPIVGLNLAFLDDDLIISAKYEFFTKMDLTNETPAGKGFVTGFDPETGQPIEMFPDGGTTNADIPAFLSVGIRYQISDKVNIQGGYHTYFDSQAGWATNEEGIEVIDRNFQEYGLGFEWNVTKKFLLSAGYLAAITGVNEYYQSDLDYSLSTTTFGAGGAIAFSDTFKLQFGGFYTMYNSQTIGMPKGAEVPLYGDTFDKSTWALSLGLDISIHKKKK